MGVTRSGFAAFKNAIWGSQTVRALTDKLGFNISSIDTNAVSAAAFAQGAADKVWGSATRALTDKSNFHISSNGDKSGYQVSSVGDKTGYNVSSIDAAAKTGYALTAGSYSIRKSNSESGAISVSGTTSNTGACGSTVEANMHLTASNRGSSNGAGEMMCTVEGTGSPVTVITARKDISNSAGVVRWHKSEYH